MPEFSKYIEQVLRRVLLYRGSKPSFSSLSAHGMIFLNVPEDANEVFFFEDIAHQAGHVVFSAATLDTGRYLMIRPDTPISVLNDDKNDHRGVYTVLHGLFTEMCMTVAMDRCLRTKTLSGSRRHEMTGRLALILTRFGIDLRGVWGENIFTQEGLNLMNWFMHIYGQVARARFEQLSALNISNQPYCFDYGLFSRDNPIIPI